MANGSRLEAFHRLAAMETDECVMWPFGRTSNGYGAVYINTVPHSVHVLACETRHGPRPERREAAHSCGNRACMNYRHLRWATPKENAADKVRHGTDPRGERAGAAKLTVDQVRAIRALHAAGMRQIDIAPRFGVTNAAVNMIVNRRSWAWLT